MVRINTIIVLAGFISISVFGLFLIPFDGSHHDVSCFASLINNAPSPCPEKDPLGFANFHSSAIKTMSNMIPIDSMSILFYLVVIFVITLFSFQSISGSDLISPTFYALYFSEQQDTRYKLQAKLHWFSLHENSPSLLGRAI